MDEFEAKKEEGLRLFQQGRQKEALAVFETAVSLAQAADNPAGEAEMLSNTGVIQRVQGNFPEAQTAFSQAEKLFTQVGDVNGQGQVL
ncbi:MAG: tetratricopeptide repeat protein, partial [Anaerolineae bacterium]